MVEAFKKIIGPSNVLYGGAEKARFSHVWATDVPLTAKGVLLPSTTEQVSKILALCYQHDVEIVVHGGLTNLVGATETTSNQWVISLEKMNAIEEIDQESKVVIAQAGTVLEHLIHAVTEKGLFLPLHFGAKGSAQIGGVVATNAGGMRVLKYGMARNLVIGIEAVLPTGEVISSLKKIIKDNSGYDLKQLFIGAEGTLGIITRVSLRLFELPTSRYAALCGVDTFKKVTRLLRHIDRELSGNLSAYELMWQSSYQVAVSAASDRSVPMHSAYSYYVFIESLGNDLGSDYIILENAITSAAEAELIVDAVMAQSDREVENLFHIRENTHALRQPFPYTQHFDISLPVNIMDVEITRIVAELEAISFVEGVLPFGHIADGNIHLVVGKSDNKLAHSQKIETVVYQNLKKYLGSVSAEHGIGLLKKPFLDTSKSKAEIALMKTLKQAIDPKNLLNPGRIF